MVSDTRSRMILQFTFPVWLDIIQKRSVALYLLYKYIWKETVKIRGHYFFLEVSLASELRHSAANLIYERETNESVPIGLLSRR